MRKRNEGTVPLSVVLITIGTILLLTAGAVYALSLADRDGELPQLIVAAQLPPATFTPHPLPTLMAERGAVLLPESPPEVNGLPSEARADEAPRALHNPLPNQPVRLVIPELQIDAPVWEVSVESTSMDGQQFLRWRVPDAYAAGWHEDSALLGQSGNTVLNGHHNVYGALFESLIDLEVGSTIFVHDLIGRHRFQVQQIELLEERGVPLEARLANAQWIAPTDDERLTIVTCWPPDNNTHRLIVIAFPVN